MASSQVCLLLSGDWEDERTSSLYTRQGTKTIAEGEDVLNHMLGKKKKRPPIASQKSLFRRGRALVRSDEVDSLGIGFHA